MKAKRLRVVGLVLAGLTLLVVAARFLRSDEPTYQGKTVGVWVMPTSSSADFLAKPILIVSKTGNPIRELQGIRRIGPNDIHPRRTANLLLI